MGGTGPSSDRIGPGLDGGAGVAVRGVAGIHRLPVGGRARGHVVGPKGRPRSGCRPEAVPGPACPWACCSRSAWWCVIGSRRSWTEWAGRSPGRAQGGGVLWGLPATWRETALPIPIAADPRRRRPARGAAPLRLGAALPLTRTVHRDATTVVVVRRGVLLRVPAAASSRPNVLEPAPLVAERVLRTASRSHGVSGWPCVLPVLGRNPSTRSPWSRPWSCGRAEGPSKVRVSAEGRPRAGMSMGVVLAERVVVLWPWRPRTRRAGGSSGRAARRRGSGGLPGHVARNSAGRSQSLRILGEGVRREAPHPFASGRHRPLPGRSTGTRRRWSRSVSRSAPRPGGCVLSA